MSAFLSDLLFNFLFNFLFIQFFVQLFVRFFVRFLLSNECRSHLSLSLATTIKFACCLSFVHSLSFQVRNIWDLQVICLRHLEKNTRTWKTFERTMWNIDRRRIKFNNLLCSEHWSSATTTTKAGKMSRFFCRFLSCHYKTTTWKCLISRFLEDMKARQRLSFSYLELRYSLLESYSRKLCQHLKKWTIYNKRLKQHDFALFGVAVFLSCLSYLLMEHQETGRTPVRSDASPRIP